MGYAFEFETNLEPGKPVKIPREISAKVPSGARVHILMTVEPESADRAIQQASYEAFDKSYVPQDDALYEDCRPR